MAIKKRKSWPKWLLVIILLGGIAGAYAWYRNRPKDAEVDFKSDTIKRGDITQTITANGQLTPVKNVQVGSQISGIVKEVNVDFNDQVTNGQVVAQIDPSTYKQNVDQAQAELLNTQAALELAELNYRRAQSLRTNDLISVSEADKALADLHQAQAAVKMREAAVKKAEVDMARTTIYAPIDGVVITRNVDVGQTVAASFNTPTLFQIANDLSKMEIDAMVSEADVGGVAEGQPVTFTVDAFPNRQFHGQVEQVRYAPTTNQNVVTYTTVVEVNNDDLKLRPGMTANVSIITAQKTNVLRLPNSALRVRPPENALVKPERPTGSVSNAPPTSAGGDMPADWGSVSREERRKRMESLPPEQQAAIRERMRQRFAEGGGSRGGSGGPWGGSRPKTDGAGSSSRTIYLLVKTNSPSGKPMEMAHAVQVKLGITDGAYTEILEGLKEGDEIITGQNLTTAPSAASRPSSSPFGSPFGRFRPR